MKTAPLLLLAGAGIAAIYIVGSASSEPASVTGGGSSGGGGGGGGGSGSSDTGVYITDPANVAIDPSGWYTLSNGTQITATPPIDTATGGYAHLRPRDWLTYAASIGARLPTLAEYDMLHAEGLHIDPVTLPTQAMVIAANPGLDLHDNNAVQAAAQAMRNSSMSSLAWDQMHDAEVRRRLAAAGWDGKQAVDNIGKHWSSPDAQTKPGHGLLYGWWWHPYPDTSKIQTPYRDHNDDQVDYGSLAHLVMLS